MGAQTNELLNIYMSFAMGENPFDGKATTTTTTTIEQQGHNRHQARCGQARQHKMMEVMWNANKGLEQERAQQDLGRVRCAFGPAAAASLFNDGAHTADERIEWVGRGGGVGCSKRSFEDELKRLLRQ